MHLYLQHEREQLVKEFEEKIGEGLGITGIQDIWSATQEGKAFKLLVEKRLSHSGFCREGGKSPLSSSTTKSHIKF